MLFYKLSCTSFYINSLRPENNLDNSIVIYRIHECADPDQTARMHSLIRICAFRIQYMYKLQCKQRRPDRSVRLCIVICVYDARINPSYRFICSLSIPWFLFLNYCFKITHNLFDPILVFQTVYFSQLIFLHMTVIRIFYVYVINYHYWFIIFFYKYPLHVNIHKPFPVFSYNLNVSSIFLLWGSVENDTCAQKKAVSSCVREKSR